MSIFTICTAYAPDGQLEGTLKDTARADGIGTAHPDTMLSRDLGINATIMRITIRKC